MTQKSQIADRSVIGNFTFIRNFINFLINNSCTNHIFLLVLIGRVVAMIVTIIIIVTKV